MSVTTAQPPQTGALEYTTRPSVSWKEPVIEEKEVVRADSPIENNGQGLPEHQNVALLHAARQPFVLTEKHPIPVPQTEDELVVKIQAIGLNPVDWKSVDYNFAIPQLPYLAGRDFAGVIVKAPTAAGHLRVGDLVLSPSTDYRDVRKSAYQEYAISTQHNVARVPQNVPLSQGASIGVAYVAAALALGVSLGLNFPKVASSDGPDLWKAVRDLPPNSLPVDVATECLSSIEDYERPQSGDWIAVWGGSSTSALFVSQIARLAGLKVILVVDVAKHGSRLAERGGSVLIDSHDPARAIDIIRAVSGNKLRFAVDTVGRETATHLAQTLRAGDGKRAHLVGLTGVPKESTNGIVYHTVPIKVFHEVPAIGSALMRWLEGALENEAVALPDVEHADGGLGGINAALDRMRRGEIRGKRLVVPL